MIGVILRAERLSVIASPNEIQGRAAAIDPQALQSDRTRAENKANPPL
jgi:hypothetical protein